MMKRSFNTIRLIGPMVLFCLLVLSCRMLDTASVGDLKTETESVELGPADEASVQIEMQAGELVVMGGADTLLDANFRYNVDEWQPSVEYSVNGSQGELLVEQPSESALVAGGNQVNEWRLSLSNDVPIDLDIQTGAGQAELDLRGLDLTGLTIQTGAGNVTVDLSGSLGQDLAASITGGVGNLSVKLPSGVGVRVSATTGLGGLTNSGLVKEGEYYVNHDYGVSPHTLFLDITTGVGAIELIAQ